MKKTKMIPWSLVLGWMILIFLLSAQTGPESGALSGGLTEALIALIRPLFPDARLLVESLESALRTHAHFIAYFVLGILLMNALTRDTLQTAASIRSFIISILYAASDEIHQYFVPGRAAELQDVLVDALGALMGILLFRLWMRQHNRRKG